MPTLTKSLLEGLEARRLFSGVEPYGAGANGVPAGWQSTFADEFDGTSLDSSKWFVRDGLRWDTTRTGDSRPNVTSPDSVSVGGGDLKLTVFSTPAAHNTGWIQTKRGDTDGIIADDVNDTKFEQSFGYWESRIKFANGAPGAWQAFWVHSYQMAGGSGAASSIGTEIDVTESAQWVDRPGTDNYVKSTIHYNGYSSGNAIATGGAVSGSVADYHVYGLKWTTSSVTFYVDGQVLGQPITNLAAISTIRQGIILSNEVSTNWSWAGGIPAAGYGTVDTSTTYMKVDYVKVWGDPTAPPPRTPTPTDPTLPVVKTTISGTLFNDANKNGLRDPREYGLRDRRVYIDTNHDGLLSILEPQAITDAYGNYTLTDVPVGTVYQVRQVLPANWTQTRPTVGLALSVSLVGTTSPVAGIDFGSWGTTFGSGGEPPIVTGGGYSGGVRTPIKFYEPIVTPIGGIEF